MSEDNKTPQERFQERLRKIEDINKRKVEVERILDGQEGIELANKEFEILVKEVEKYIDTNTEVKPYDKSYNSISVTYGGGKYLLIFGWWLLRELKDSRLDIVIRERISDRTSNPKYSDDTPQRYTFDIDIDTRQGWKEGNSFFFTETLVENWFNSLIERH